MQLLTFLLHLSNHSEKKEGHLNHLNEHINWHKIKAKLIVEFAKKNNMISIENEIISLTPKGKIFTEKAIDYIITNDDSKIESMKKDFFLFRG